MSIRLTNTLSRQKDELVPLDPANVRMYVCGPTVYDFAHIGNARPVIVFDVLYRLLRHTYGAEHVTYVRNITDIDDKINARAAQVAAAKGIPVEQARVEITSLTAQQYLDDVAALGCLMPNHSPRATEYVPGMVAMIAALIATGHAYEAEGHVLFDVSSKPDYGKLSRRSLDEMMAGARVEVAPYKKNPMDFVLWKPSDDLTPGWPSPWGRGRPGWHIECSVMGGALLGETFDIHGGGVDLMFPHHENEIAQSEGCHHGAPLAQIWMHNGFLQVEGEKMSKSLGNFVTIRELFRGWHNRVWTGSAARWAMLQTHYRDPIDWTHEGLLAATAELSSFAAACDPFSFKKRASYDDLWSGEPKPSEKLIEALSDDLNLPEAIKVMRDELKALTPTNDQERAQFLQDVRFLGLFERTKIRSYRASVGIRGNGVPVEIVGAASANLRALQVYQANNDLSFAQTAQTALNDLSVRVVDATYGIWEGEYSSRPGTQGLSIDAAIAARTAARKAKDFKESDRIRDELLAKGIVLKDGPTDTTWEVKK